MKTAVRDQLRGHEGKNAARKAENRRNRRHSRQFVKNGRYPHPFARHSLERVLI